MGAEGVREIISPEYAALNRQLHDDRADYGHMAAQNLSALLPWLRKHKVILDFGCGKGSLKIAAKAIAPEFTVLEYDPAIEGKDILPTDPVDMVVALDVMEHIEPEYLDAVLTTIQGLQTKEVLMVIDKMPAKKTLSDGRNAHLIQKPGEWWRAELAKYFRTSHEEETAKKYLFIGTPL